jgi:cytochrome c1
MMQKKFEIVPFLLVAAFVGALGFSATSFAAGKDKPDPKQFARGAKAWAKTCSRCHNMKAARDNTDEEWHVDVTHMRVRANIPGDMARDIEAFLRASN